MIASGQFTISKISDGASLYTWIRYADSPTSGMSSNPVGKKYLGVAYNKITNTPSSNYSDYTWSLIEGDGISSVVEEHAKNTNKTTAPTSGWTTANLTWTSGEYLWTRLKIIYVSGKIEYTTPICDSSWEAANKVQDNINKELTTIRSDIGGVKSIADKNALSIQNEVWKDSTIDVVDADGNIVSQTIEKILVSNTQDINGVKTTVSNVKTDLEGSINDLDTRVTTAEQTVDGFTQTVEKTYAKKDTVETLTSAVEQNAEKIGLVVKDGSTTSSLTLTNQMVEAITKQFVIKSPDGSATIISGGKITTDNIAGTNGWINLAKGTFNYGNGALSWDGKTFSIGGSFKDEIVKQFVVTSSDGKQTIISGGKITTNNIVGTNGWINLSSGTFNYGNGALSWDGKKLVIGGSFKDEVLEEVTQGALTIIGDTIEPLENQTEALTSDNAILYGNGIITMTFSTIDGTDGWVYYFGRRVTIPKFEVNLSLDVFKSVVGFVVHRTNGTNYIVWYEGSVWKGQLANGTGNVTSWTWDNSTDIVLAEFHKRTADSISYAMYSPARCYEDVRTVAMLGNWAYGAISESTTINGGLLQTHTVVTSKLATDAIKSLNYSYSSGNFSSNGTFLDLATGIIRSKNFAIDSSGNAFFKGDVTATNLVATTRGQIGPWQINATSIYKGSSALGTAGSGNMYFGNNGLSISNVFKVDSAGNLITSSINATGGIVGCWHINSNRMYDNTGSGGYTGVNKYGAGQAFWAGGTDLTGNNAPFHVNHNGHLVSMSAEMSNITVFDKLSMKNSTTGNIFNVLRVFNETQTQYDIILIGPDNSTSAVRIPGYLEVLNSLSVIGNINTGGYINLDQDMSIRCAQLNLIRMYTGNTNYSQLTAVGNTTNHTSIYCKSNVWKNGSGTTYFQTTSSSDKRLKVHIGDLSAYELFFKQISPIAFRYHDGLYNAPNKSPLIQFGFYAQDVIKAFDKAGINWHEQELVVVEDGELTEEERKYVEPGTLLKMNYQNLTALNTHMIQKYMDKIEALEARIKQLEEKLAG